MIRQEYYKWLCRFIFTSRRRNYKRLIKYLHGVEFTYFIPFDENRYEDGLALRKRFAYDNDYDEDHIVNVMGDDPCSVLEMMIALAIRCEEHIMEDIEYGDRTGQWFWSMIDNAGFGSLTDLYFNTGEAEQIVDRVLNRTYSPCGEGGLFHVKHNCREDLRTVELWYQLNWYLDDYFIERRYYEHEFE